MKIKSGFAFHVHHDRLVEFCTDYDERVKYIKTHKPKEEQKLRLRLFKLILKSKLPKPFGKAWAEYNKAWAEYGKARAEYNKAWAECGKAWAECDKARAECDKAGAEYNKAWAECDKAWAEYEKAWAECDKARAKYEPQLIKLHKELCPNCTWDGKTIFPDRRI